MSHQPRFRWPHARVLTALLAGLSACQEPGPAPAPTHDRLASDPAVVYAGGTVQLRALADAGDLRACQVLAERLLAEEGENSRWRAADYLRRAARGGLTTAQFALASLLEGGTLEAEDPDEAERWFRCAAEQGHLGSATGLGLLLVRRGDSAADVEARRWFAVAADAGEARAQSALAALFVRGRGGPRDPVAGAELARRAAEQGEAQAQAFFGELLLRGEGVASDEREAARWLKPAAEAGLAVAQLNLGQLYLRGAGVEEDARAGARWIKLAAEQGLASAQCKLAQLLEHGRGVERDPARALAWYRRAAAQGEGLALEGVQRLEAVEPEAQSRR